MSRVTCPVGTGPLQVGSADLSAACDANALNPTPDGASTFTVTTVIGSGSANFRDISASCTSGSAVTGGAVSVHSGVAGAPFTTSTLNQTIIDDNGVQYILNEVTTDGTQVIHNAIRVLSGSAAGFISGQVICPLAADVSITKACTPGPVVPGAVITCSVTVFNGGAGTATEVSVTDTLPAGVTLQGTPAGAGFTCGTGAVFACHRPTLAAGTTAALTFSARVQDVSPGSSLVNSASVSSGTSDPNNGNNNALATTVVATCQITAQPGVILYGTAGDDVLCGTEGPDRIAGLGGNDTIFGLEGDDQVTGGEGDDVILGGAGSDTLVGSSGNDRLFGGGRGVDRLSGGPGDDYLNTVDGSADDQLAGSEHVTGDTCVGDVGDAKALCEL